MRRCSTSMTRRVDTPWTYHRGRRQIHRLVGAGSLLRGGGTPIAGTHLRHPEGRFAKAGEHGLGLEAVGVVAPGLGAPVRTGADERGALDPGGFIDRKAQGPSRTVESILEQDGMGGLRRVRFDSHRHGGYAPFSKSWRQTRHRAACRAGRFGAPRLRSRTADHGNTRNLQKERYTTAWRSSWAP